MKNIVNDEPRGYRLRILAYDDDDITEGIPGVFLIGGTEMVTLQYYKQAHR